MVLNYYNALFQLLFRGNADEVGTNQGLVDDWIEISVGGANRYIFITNIYRVLWIKIIKSIKTINLMSQLNTSLDTTPSSYSHFTHLVQLNMYLVTTT